MSFNHLFMTARVVTAVYKIASTGLLMIYLVNRVAEGRRVSRKDTRRRVVQQYLDGPPP